MSILYDTWEGPQQITTGIEFSNSNNNNNNHNNKLNESANIEKTFTMRLKQQIKQIELNRNKIENRKF